MRSAHHGPLATMFALLAPLAATAQTPSELDYMLHCRGCHGPDGTAHSKVPGLRDGLSSMMRIPGGREYLVRVPGVARAALDDDRLATLLNWLLARFDDGASHEDVYPPYSAAEVARLRASPLTDPLAERARLMSAGASQGSQR